ncbi:T9SS C-terminal target domain-containing protein [Maribacter algicola]|uniref:T9SS C-terminal target domain-containing protein n=1 Tax=Maribacter algicola TaxID=2498892 RepID=A0A426RI02_9FLAO|nr:T9SS C-terminal target domain-containing protein [Maribacter algicola]RRQ48578.1 T9SS C-terminal target domain-containing protein [Maribacter algicola]
MKYVTAFLFLIVSVLKAQQTVSVVGVLDTEINETSGLLFFNDRLITHNDSGNEPVLYEMDTTSLAITRRITITNAENKDWEALAQDATYIYIGDFGNNVGTRTDLVIYRIEKSDYLASDQVQAEVIEFSYEDQVDYSDTGNSDWDAEAFISLDNTLVVFTKQWQSLGSVAYAIPKTIGNHTATRIDSINEVGLVTDAVYNSSKSELYLLGYSSILTPFLIKFSGSDSTNLFNGEAERFDIGLQFVQTEGITQINSTDFYITSEFFSRQTPSITSEARLFKLQFPNPEFPEEEPETPETPEKPETPKEPIENEQEETIIIYKDMNFGSFLYEIQTPNTVFGSAIFDASGRLVWISKEEVSTSGVISRNVFGPGIFYFAAYLNTGTISVPFALY